MAGVRSCEEPGLPVIVTVLGSPPWPDPGIVIVMGLPMAVVVLADDTITMRMPLELTAPDTGITLTLDVGVPVSHPFHYMVAHNVKARQHPNLCNSQLFTNAFIIAKPGQEEV